MGFWPKKLLRKPQSPQNHTLSLPNMQEVADKAGFGSFRAHFATHMFKGQPQTSQRRRLHYSPEDWRIPEPRSLERCMTKLFSKLLISWQTMQLQFSRRPWFRQAKLISVKFRLRWKLQLQTIGRKSRKSMSKRMMYLAGQGGPQNRAEAENWFTRLMKNLRSSRSRGMLGHNTGERCCTVLLSITGLRKIARTWNTTV